MRPDRLLKYRNSIRASQICSEQNFLNPSKKRWKKLRRQETVSLKTSNFNIRKNWLLWKKLSTNKWYNQCSFSLSLKKLYFLRMSNRLKISFRPVMTLRPYLRLLSYLLWKGNKKSKKLLERSRLSLIKSENMSRIGFWIMIRLISLRLRAR
jgi:hypothetical protein